jgi:cytochrome P450
MAPIFQPRHIASYAETMVCYGERLQQAWHDGEVVDLNQHMIALTMSIIGKVLFDTDVFTKTDELGAAMAIVNEEIVHKATSLVQIPEKVPTPRNRRVRKAAQVIRNHIGNLIAERHAGGTERNDFLSVLLHATDEEGKAMSDEQLMDECLTLFGAGYETTAAALSWAWYLLC